MMMMIIIRERRPRWPPLFFCFFWWAFRTPGLPRTGPHGAHACVSRSGTNKVVGKVTIVGHIDLSKLAPWKAAKQQHRLGTPKMAIEKWVAGAPVWGWLLSDAQRYDPPQAIIDLTQLGRGPKKFVRVHRRNLGLDKSLSKLHHKVLVEFPTLRLNSTAKFSMDQLVDKDYESLEAMAKALDGKTLRLGTTCSGTDAPVIACIHTIDAINLRFDVCICILHVFSVELDPEKRKYLRECFDIQHIFQDVAIFEEGHGYCTIERKDIPIPKVDLLFSGPSCTDISNEQELKNHFASCYETGLGVSGRTYQQGFSRAIDVTEAKVAFFENVTSVMKQLVDTKGVRQKPQIKVVEKDMAKKGMLFTYSAVDSRDFLVRQRRSRFPVF